MDKNSARKEAKRIIAGIDERGKKDIQIMERIISLPVFRSADVILSYCALADEVDISEIFDSRFLFPFLEGNDMFFSRAPLKRGRFSIFEPLERTELPYENALLLVPALSYTESGIRLGRGMGYYDRYARKNRKRIFTCGIIYSDLIMDFETEEHDMKADALISDSI